MFNEKDYKPYYLKSYERIGQNLLILTIDPLYTDSNSASYLHQIHIVSDELDVIGLYDNHGFPRIIREKVPIFLLQLEYPQSKRIIEICEGEYYSESIVSFFLGYTSMEEKRIK